MPTPTFAIVGAGLAGAKAAETLRAEGFDGRLVLLGDEPERPYDRPPLSKAYLRGETTRDTLWLHGEGFYDQHEIELRTATPVRSIDAAGRRLELASGERLGYQRLLLATGSSPRRLRVPGADLDGILYLRSVRDADRLAAALDHGVHLRLGTRVAAFRGHGQVEQVVIADGHEIPADLVLVGAGASPRTELAEAAGLAVGDGILVDQYLASGT